MKITKISIIFLSILLISCSGSKKDFTKLVDPFIGTGGHGHTFPGPTRPYGMVQLSPDSRLYGWDGCSGYHTTDSVIYGFSHTHLSGTGIGDYGDILLLPTTGDLNFEGDNRITSTFKKSNETAEVGYYSVLLDDFGIKAELASSLRAGFHKYTFPKSDDASIVIDLKHTVRRQRNKELSIKVISDTEIQGMKRTGGWAVDQVIYFYAKFSKPFNPTLVVNGNLKPELKEIENVKNLRAKLSFNTEEGEVVLAKVGISAVSCEGAKKNVDAEITDWDFNTVVQDSKKEWNKLLSKVEVEGGSADQQTIFYTSLYHSMLSPNVFMDVDSSYKGMDRQVHKSKDFTNHTIFSIWDTFRGLHPLLTILNPEKDNELIKTLLHKRAEGGLLPKWELAGNYTGTMLGYHSASVILDAYNKGITNFNAEEALQAMVEASTYDTTLLKVKDYNNAAGNVLDISKKYVADIKYIPGDKTVASVAKGLEYAYDDWCIAQLAKKLGKNDIYEKYIARSNYYKTYYDKETQFMRGIMTDGSWRTPFDPNLASHWKTDYCEGNAWQWTWFVPHDVEGYRELVGGKAMFTERLDSLFTTSSELSGDDVSGDISGLIGQYVHGNEPSHHIIHLYNYSSTPWKTQFYADKVLDEMYFNNPNGLAGNEDCGQMSSWYVLNAIGFYPVCPGKPEYSIGRPLFDKVKINLDNGNTFTVITENNSPENKYIASISLNGKEMSTTDFLQHEDILSGSTLTLKMSNSYE